MTLTDLLALDVGDSIIGLGNRWVDEWPVTGVGAVMQCSGRTVRAITVQRGRSTHSALVRDGDTTIRGAHI